MNRRISYLVLSVAWAALAACGGGGGGGGGSTLPSATPTPSGVKPTPTPTVAPTATPTPSVTATFRNAPSYVATQSGSGPWTAATPRAGIVSIALPSSTTSYGIAYVCPQVSVNYGASNQEFIVQGTLADSNALTLTCPTSVPPASPANISGTFDISAIASANNVQFYEAQYGINGPFSGPTGSYTGAGLAGTFDLVALALAGRDVAGAKILRGQNVVNGTVINVPPFTAADASTTETVTLPQLLAPFTPYMTVTYVTSGGTRAILSDPSVMTSYGSIPATEAANGDYYDALYTQTRATASGLETMSVEQTFTTPGPLSFVMPRGPQFYTVGAAPYPSFSFDNASLSTSGIIYDNGTVSWSSNPQGYSISAYVTSKWLGLANTYSIPNLTALQGFFTPPASNTPVTWSQAANETSASFAALLSNGIQPLNSTRQTVSITGNFTEP